VDDLDNTHESSPTRDVRISQRRSSGGEPDVMQSLHESHGLDADDRLRRQLEREAELTPRSSETLLVSSHGQAHHYSSSSSHDVSQPATSTPSKRVIRERKVTSVSHQLNGGHSQAELYAALRKAEQIQAEQRRQLERVQDDNRSLRAELSKLMDQRAASLDRFNKERQALQARISELHQIASETRQVLSQQHTLLKQLQSSITTWRSDQASFTREQEEPFDFEERFGHLDDQLKAQLELLSKPTKVTVPPAERDERIGVLMERFVSLEQSVKSLHKPVDLTGLAQQSSVLALTEHLKRVSDTVGHFDKRFQPEHYETKKEFEALSKMLKLNLDKLAQKPSVSHKQELDELQVSLRNLERWLKQQKPPAAVDLQPLHHDLSTLRLLIENQEPAVIQQQAAQPVDIPDYSDDFAALRDEITNLQMREPRVIQLPAPEPQVIQLPAPEPQIIRIPAEPQVVHMPAPATREIQYVERASTRRVRRVVKEEEEEEEGCPWWWWLLPLLLVSELLFPLLSIHTYPHCTHWCWCLQLPFLLFWYGSRVDRSLCLEGRWFDRAAVSFVDRTWQWAASDGTTAGYL
jgi:hypothetical protein